MKTAEKHWEKWIYMLISIGAFAMVLAAVHDMQTAQGIGLYFAMLAGNENRMIFDILTDGLAVGITGLLLLVPCLVSGHRSIGSFLRLFSAFMAFMPILDFSVMIHLFDGKGGFPAWGELLRFVIIYLLLLWCFNRWEKWYQKVPGLDKWGWILFGCFWLRGLYRIIVIMSAY